VLDELALRPTPLPLGGPDEDCFGSSFPVGAFKLNTCTVPLSLDNASH
jgi:hypothetical protein